MSIWILLSAFCVSFVVTIAVVRSRGALSTRASDIDLDGPQKFHHKAVPRVGGLGILLGTAAGATWMCLEYGEYAVLTAGLLGAAMPAFASGLLEDLTKSQSARRRLFFTALSAALAFWWVDAAILRTGIPGLDWLVSHPWGAAAITVFVVTGVANSVNIIDGFNGLSSMCSAIMLAGLAYVAFQVGDTGIGWLALAGVGAILGFFVFNFPAGLIFLGDGGAYFLGFFLAELAILLMQRNADVSPMFPLLLCVYPVFETLFSIYRRKWLRGKPVGMPDGAHLHSLIYRRFMRWAAGPFVGESHALRNSMTSPYLWVMCSASVLPALLWYHNTAVLAFFIVAFAAAYVSLYWRIVRFRSPRFLPSGRQRRARRG